LTNQPRKTISQTPCKVWTMHGSKVNDGDDDDDDDDDNDDHME
jgi:hypothetical protein